jgi:hypothetical protein
LPRDLAPVVTRREELVDYQPRQQGGGEKECYDKSQQFIDSLHSWTRQKHQATFLLSGHSTGTLPGLQIIIRSQSISSLAGEAFHSTQVLRGGRPVCPVPKSNALAGFRP